MNSIDLSSDLSAVVFAFSLLFGLAYYLMTSVSPGGFVVPGSLVVSGLEGPASLLTICGVAAITYGLMKVIERFTILYGKRLFALSLVLSTVFGLIAFEALHVSVPNLFPGDSLGFLVPGLIVYQLMRQNTKSTLISTAVVTAATTTVAVALLAI
ncbi:MAG: poly-gamma-glutamate biosynthesis protein PgsC/CapC [Mycobacterium sp.]